MLILGLGETFASYKPLKAAET